MGRLELQREDFPLTDIQANKTLGLLSYLAVTGGSHNRSTLAGLLWGNMPEAKARGNLSKALSTLRQVVGDHLTITRQTITFNEESDFWLDVAEFEAGANDGSIERLQAAIQLYEGDFLDGFYVRNAPEFEDWVLAQRARLKELALRALHTLAAHFAERNDAGRAQAIAYTRRLLALEPWREEAHRQMMRLLALNGQRGMALAQYETCRHVLVEELGVEPGAETTVLYGQIRDGMLSKQAAKTSPTPIHPSAPPAKLTPHNLPPQPTPFIGREAELSRLTTLLADPTVKLITILGLGGMGKTRLSIEAARAKAEAFVDGVYFVSLAPIDDPGFISSKIAEALDHPFNIRDQREHWEYDTQIEQLLAYLKDKQLLLVLDNTEHLLSTAFPSLDTWERSVNQLAAEIVQIAPGIKILATSRERLNLLGETLVLLDGLEVPDWKTNKTNGAPSPQKIPDLATYGAVELFRQGARRVRPDFELRPDNLGNIIDICRLVDGMPLGIELAAAWTELLSSAEIVAEIHNSLDFLETDLHNIPDRQRSIRLVIESTWNQLTPTEQAIFQQLSIFRGGFSREAAQTVAGASLRTLMALVNKSLLRPDFKDRYQLHELLRQFAAEHLGQDPAAETAAKDRHCRYYTIFLHQKEADLYGQNQGQTLEDIEVEEDNVRAAWQWAVTQGKLPEMDQAMESLCEYYRIRGRIDEGWRFFDPAARALGWGGFGAEEDTPDSDTMFNNMLQLLDVSSSKDANGNQQKKLLGKVLARYNRFY